jgi:cytochrome c553
MHIRALSRRVALAVALLAASTAYAGGVNVSGIADTCNNCHGMKGVSTGGAMPTIAGQPEAYLTMVMRQHQSGERFVTAMGRLLKGYTPDEIAVLAKHYASLPWVPAAKFEEELAQTGRRAYMRRCMGCHGAKGERLHDGMPRIGGQWPDYTVLELQKYANADIGMPSGAMANAVRGMRNEDFVAIAHFLASQKED